MALAVQTQRRSVARSCARAKSQCERRSPASSVRKPIAIQRRRATLLACWGTTIFQCGQTLATRRDNATMMPTNATHRAHWAPSDVAHCANNFCDLLKDTLAERLRRRPAKPMGSPRVGSNPTGVVWQFCGK